jgi:L-lysine 6-transaminase
MQGDLLLAGLRDLAGEFPEILSNARGRGLMCAVDAAGTTTRDRLIKALLAEKLIVVGCGEKGIRFRPHLIVTGDEVRQGIETLRKVLRNGGYARIEIKADSCPGGGT